MRSTLVGVGSKAPTFVLPNTDGASVRLDDLAADTLLLLFFRGFWCESCQAQLAQLRAEYEEITDRSSNVVAISADTVERSHLGNQVIRLPFSVLCDPERSVIAAYGVLHEPDDTGPGIARPSVFVLDRDLIVRFAYIGDHPNDRPKMNTLLLALDSIT